eukprot:280067-Pelagomonas_calceolata.AAC.1
MSNELIIGYKPVTAWHRKGKVPCLCLPSRAICIKQSGACNSIRLAQAEIIGRKITCADVAHNHSHALIFIWKGQDRIGLHSCTCLQWLMVAVVTMQTEQPNCNSRAEVDQHPSDGISRRLHI